MQEILAAQTKVKGHAQ